MAKNDRPDDDAPPRRAKRRRRPPPVLELEAKEVEGAGDKTEKGTADSETRDSDAPSGTTFWNQWWDRAGVGEWRKLASPLLAGALGAIAGALLVFLLSPREPTGQTGDPRVGDLANEVATLSARIETLTARAPAPVAADQSKLAERIDRLTSTISEAEQRLAAMEQRPLPQAPDLSAVNERTAAIETTVKELRTALADLRKMAEATPAAATPASIEGLANRIVGLEQQIDSIATARASASTDASTLAAELVALNGLAAAVRSGKPFAGELEAARVRLGDRATALAPLAPFAAQGVPTVATLAERFSALAPELLREPQPANGFISRLVANATRLVEIRPVGEPEGTSVGAIVARMETKLGRGDLAGALADAEALPDSAKTRLSDWLAAAKQRQNAAAIVQQQIAASLSGNAEQAKP